MDTLFALFIVFGPASILTFFLIRSQKKLKAVNKENNSLKNELAVLAPYRKIVDAQEEKERILQKAHDEAIRLERESAKQIQKEKDEVERQLLSAREKREKLSSEVNSMIAIAYKESERIVSKANEDAKKIAGDALEAKEKADFYTKTAEAMKRVICGYGDEFIIPRRTLLDDLAEDFEYEEAGKKYKMLSGALKAMIKDGKAASCAYAEENRRKTAINLTIGRYPTNRREIQTSCLIVDLH